jgi:hypothetical protein
MQISMAVRHLISMHAYHLLLRELKQGVGPNTFTLKVFLTFPPFPECFGTSSSQG